MNVSTLIEIVKLYYSLGESAPAALCGYKTKHGIIKDPFTLSTSTRLIAKFESTESVLDFPGKGRKSLSDDHCTESRRATSVPEHHGIFVNNSDWSYFSDWVKTYPNCAGNKQSPIDLVENEVQYNSSLGPVNIFPLTERSAATLKFTLFNTGHSAETFAVSFGDSTIADYEVYQIHFHWGSNVCSGSEHKINGKSYVFETHVVTYKKPYRNFETALTKNDGLAVLSFLHKLDDGAPPSKNQISMFGSLETYLQFIHNEGNVVTMNGFDLSRLLVQVDPQAYYRYHGSLTTPPCTENVMWTVFRQPVSIWNKQLTKTMWLDATSNGNVLGNVTLATADYKQMFDDIKKIHDSTVLTKLFNATTTCEARLTETMWLDANNNEAVLGNVTLATTAYKQMFDHIKKIHDSTILIKRFNATTSCKARSIFALFMNEKNIWIMIKKSQYRYMQAGLPLSNLNDVRVGSNDRIIDPLLQSNWLLNVTMGAGIMDERIIFIQLYVANCYLASLDFYDCIGSRRRLFNTGYAHDPILL
ncbi:carbonic anhydrase [Clonorchis sinensis]|uniref:carbonic anhydrase n=1 Tax=Clonorchis sinensis TaxID=79923 RepID=G7YCA4_CLOSI|nr:carbonic anhydrase [Clonorchis sinensis]